MHSSVELQKKLVNYIVMNSHHDPHRCYIGLSSIADCERVIFDRYLHGNQATITEKMRCSLSYDLEALLIQKLRAMRTYSASETITLYDGLVQGHTDGRIGRDLLEIKTISTEQGFPEQHVPFRVFYQVQAYMHYLNVKVTQVLYLARDNGAIRVYGVFYSKAKGVEIAEKVERLVTAIKEMKRPECTCGKCNN